MDLAFLDKPINMAGSNGNITLVLGEDKIEDIDDKSKTITDYVRFRSASKYIGTGVAPNPSTTKIIRRKALIDIDDNKEDFIFVNLE